MHDGITRHLLSWERRGKLSFSASSPKKGENWRESLNLFGARARGPWVPSPLVCQGIVTLKCLFCWGKVFILLGWVGGLFVDEAGAQRPAQHFSAVCRKALPDPVHKPQQQLGFLPEMETVAISCPGPADEGVYYLWSLDCTHPSAPGQAQKSNQDINLSSPISSLWFTPAPHNY